MKKIKCGVYKITCIPNGKIYIGSSKNIDKRWRKHIDELRYQEHPNKFLQQDYNLYGEDKFKFEIIEFCPEDERLALEQEYINHYQPFAHLNIGYNIYQKVSGYNENNSFIYMNYDKFGFPRNVKDVGSRWNMNVDEFDYINKDKNELYEEYEGYTTMKYLEKDMIMCNPDYE